MRVNFTVFSGVYLRVSQMICSGINVTRANCWVRGSLFRNNILWCGIVWTLSNTKAFIVDAADADDAATSPAVCCCGTILPLSSLNHIARNTIVYFSRQGKISICFVEMLYLKYKYTNKFYQFNIPFHVSYSEKPCTFIILKILKLQHGRNKIKNLVVYVC